MQPSKPWKRERYVKNESIDPVLLLLFLKKMMRYLILAAGLLNITFAFSQSSYNEDIIITSSKVKNGFIIAEKGKTALLLINSTDFPGVKRAVNDLRSDIGKVTGSVPDLSIDTILKKDLIIIGTVGKSSLIDDLAERGKIDISGLKDKWETFHIQVVNKPLPGVRSALVITGSDKRGTIFGIYELSKQIGVSPWYWWADVPSDHREALYIKPGIMVQGPPSVKYRGLFLNDEAPALSNWVAAKYGKIPVQTDPPVPQGVANYGHEFYTRLFELMLRLKANYLWPAMWNNSFNEDDPDNSKLADEYGIVMGTSHQEPMLRAQKEWDRRYIKSIGTWNYSKHPEILEAFWREGIRRNKNFESIITIGLRGANDTEMAPGGPAANKTLLEGIVESQRKILAMEMKQDVTAIPQLWCLYKEVQDYYNAGMRVPEDVTLLWAEDNWGNVRRLPTAEERERSGGAGIYYHFDYHGGPRSYQWINTNPVSKIWDQMSLAKQYGADKIWIVNAGHFKGYEFPLEYFITLGWNSGSLSNDNISSYTKAWAERQFGKQYADEIAVIMSDYTRFNGRRKPELLEPSTYSLINYNEAENIVSEYNDLAKHADEIYNKLPLAKRDAFWQLVLFPVKACAIVNELYITAGKNDLWAKQGRAAANEMALQTRRLFSADTSLMGYHNRTFAGGKWNHFMDQAHLGYTSWADPPVNSLRAVRLKESEIPDDGAMGISIEGSAESWPDSQSEAVLPESDIFKKQIRSIDIFNKGKARFDFIAEPDKSWIILIERSGQVTSVKKLTVQIDWEKVPEGRSSGKIRITGTGKELFVTVNAFKPSDIKPGDLKGFAEGEGVVSVEAEHFTSKSEMTDRKWVRIEGFGHTLSGMRANAETDAAPAIPGKDSPCLEYKMYLFTTGVLEVLSTFAPTLNFIPGRPLQAALSFDDETPQIITLVPENYNAQNRNADWEKTVRDNARVVTSKHTITKPGYHSLKIWMVDPGVVIQKIVVNTGGLRPSYLGPPESYRSFQGAL
jgi:hypothetical protein